MFRPFVHPRVVLVLSYVTPRFASSLSRVPLCFLRPSCPSHPHGRTPPSTLSSRTSRPSYSLSPERLLTPAAVSGRHRLHRVDPPVTASHPTPSPDLEQAAARRRDSIHGVLGLGLAAGGDPRHRPNLRGRPSYPRAMVPTRLERAAQSSCRW